MNKLHSQTFSLTAIFRNTIFQWREEIHVVLSKNKLKLEATGAHLCLCDDASREFLGSLQSINQSTHQRFSLYSGTLQSTDSTTIIKGKY